MYKDRLTALRAALPTDTGFLVPRTDAYQGEYIRPCDERLHWLTGFTGSAGACVVTADKAVLFVDGRYTLQARQQVDTDTFEVIDVTQTPIATWASGQIVGVDPWLMSVRQDETYRKKGVALAYMDNPIDALWHDRPSVQAAPAYMHDLAYAGEATDSKIAHVLEALDAAYDAVLLTKPESLNWLLNIRGNDIAHTPVVLCYGVLYRDGRIDLVLDADRVPAGLSVNTVTLDELKTTLQGLDVAADFTTTPMWFQQNLTCTLTHVADPCEALKACKNATELDGARLAHFKDGTAVCATLAHAKDFKDELDIVAKLEQARAKQDTFKDSSFDTIAGVNENGAIIHYRATPETNKAVASPSMILIDSGGQYLEGTTDITRTLYLGGQPTAQQQHHYTRVLKGLITLSALHWPKGLAGRDIDALARAALWREGLDYAHGTGHGVGSFLSVHEGPQGLSKRNTVPLEPGMILSIEPGYYLEGHYGIRLENLAIVQPSHYNGFLCFETLTLCPFDRKLIDKTLLTKDELDWLNAYHKTVFDALNARVSMMDSVWLSEACAVIP